MVALTSSVMCVYVCVCGGGVVMCGCFYGFCNVCARACLCVYACVRACARVCVCVCVGSVMCGCFGYMYKRIYCSALFILCFCTVSSMYIYSYLHCLTLPPSDNSNCS